MKKQSSKLFEKKDKTNIKEDFLTPRKKLMQLSEKEKAEHENFINGMQSPHYGKKFDNYFWNIFSNLIGCITKGLNPPSIVILLIILLAYGKSK